MELLEPRADPCPVVHIEWDRGHDAFDALIRATSDEAVIVTLVEDYWPLAGCRWIRANEIVSCDDHEAESPVVRVLDHLGVRTFGVSVELLSLRHLLAHPTFSSAPVQVYVERTGSSEVQVGVVASVGLHDLVLGEITPRGERNGESDPVPLDQIIGVEWGSDYLTALRILVGE